MPVDGSLPEANLRFDAKDLTLVSAVLGQALEGRASGQLQMSRKRRGQARLDARFETLRGGGYRAALATVSAQVTGIGADGHADFE